MNSKVLSLEKKIAALEKDLSENVIYKHFFNESKDLVCIANLDGYFTKVNPAFTEILGYSLEELISQPFSNFIHPEDLKKTSEEVEFMNTEGNSTIKFENRYITKTGEVVFLEWNTTVDNKTNTIFAIARDITEKKIIEDKLKTSEQLMSAAQTISKLGSWRFSINDSQVYWSDELYNIFEIEKNTDQLYQEYLAKFNSKDLEKLNNLVTQAITECKSYSFKHAVNLSNGRVKWVSCSGVPFSENGSVVKIEGFVQDITEQEQIQELILKNVKDKEVLLQELHHRVKNNMQVISSILNLQSSLNDDPIVKNIFKDSKQRIKSMAIVHDLLYRSTDFSKVNFSNYSQTIIDDIISSYKDDNCKIQVDFDVPEIYFKMDKAVPIGLFINEIITNSIKHGFKSCKKGVIKFHMKPENENKCFLEISDNGSGFNINSISPTDTLGFMLIENLAEQIDGKLNLESNNNGTRYTLLF